jgi:hypothetical protein
MVKQLRKNLVSKKIFALSFLALPFLLAILYELKTNEIEATFFSWYSQDMNWNVDKGKNNRIVFPLDGPYDITMGYSRLPDFQKHLENTDYVISRQARQSQKIQSLLRNGIAIPYDKKLVLAFALMTRMALRYTTLISTPNNFLHFKQYPLTGNAFASPGKPGLLNYKRPLNPRLSGTGLV